MKILLVYPEFPDTFWSFKHALNFISKKSGTPPLGLLTVAAMLPADWQVRLVDMNVQALRNRHLRWADYVFLSGMSVQKTSARKVIARCRRIGTKTVAGGPLFTTGWEDFPEVDHLVLGEAESILPEFLHDLQAGCARRIYRAETKPKLAVTPPPRLELLRMKYYASMVVQFSRGCPFDCDFCDITLLYGRRVRLKSTEQVLAELEQIYRRGWRENVFFVDDNFIGNKRVLKQELLPALVEWMRERKYPFSFNTQASINIADDERLLELMSAAGFDNVFIGIETPSAAGLQECSKVQNEHRDMVASVRKIQRAGIEVQGGFIVGFDSDPKTIFEDQIRFIQESSIVTAMVGLLTALKGTKLYHRLRRENRLVSEETGNNTDGSLNFEPAMDRDVLISGYKRIVGTIYSPRYYYSRVKQFLQEYTPPARPIFRMRPMHIKALFKSVLFLGVIGKERFQYWKLMLWAIFRRPRCFPLATTLAIYGFHYRRVFEKHL
ncbi:MAG: B12-binding domain-containing radical SAM protein [Spirochaetota bacterium]